MGKQFQAKALILHSRIIQTYIHKFKAGIHSIDLLLGKKEQSDNVNIVQYKKDLLQVRLELTTPAYLYSVYKYRALTDCATGAPSGKFEQL